MERRGYFKRYDSYRRLSRVRFQDTTLFVTLALWICTLPLLAIFALPFLGWKVTAYLSGFLLVVDLVACWILCTYLLTQKTIEG